MQLSNPTNGWLSDPFGPRDIPSSPFHHGLDFGYFYATKDLRVFAAADGVVADVYYSTSMGWMIAIKHEDGTVTEYCHLQDRGILVAGQRVGRREHIGTMGTTGTAALGALHLHFQYRVNGDRVDPALYMTDQAGPKPTPIEDELGAQIMDQTRYYWKEDGGTVYGIFGATYPGGYTTTTDVNTAAAWGKLFGKNDGSPFGKLSAPVWEKLSAEAAVMNSRWLAQQRAIITQGSMRTSL